MIIKLNNKVISICICFNIYIQQTESIKIRIKKIIYILHILQLQDIPKPNSLLLKVLIFQLPLFYLEWSSISMLP